MQQPSLIREVPFLFFWAFSAYHLQRTSYKMPLENHASSTQATNATVKHVMTSNATFQALYYIVSSIRTCFTLISSNGITTSPPSAHHIDI